MAKKPLFYRMLWKTVRFFYGKREFVGLENIPQEPCIIIGNHAQAHGPLSCELHFPAKKKIWCIGQMMHVKEVPAYAYQDFWSFKPKWTRWWYKLLSYLMAPLCGYVFNHADTIAVYKDARGLSTFKESVKALGEGAHVIIFPEKGEKYNEIVNAFQDKFVDVARLYYKRYKKAVSFVPMYNAPSLRKIVFGKPIAFDPTLSPEELREKICTYLQKEITRLAKELPKHRVVPYENIKKKNYPYNK